MFYYSSVWSVSYDNNNVVVRANNWQWKMEDQKGEVEEVKALKYLGIWLDRGMCGIVQLEETKKKRQRNGQGRQNG